MRTIAALFAALVVAFALALPAHASTAYGSRSAQRMDVIPGADGRRPGVFLVHGGWWSEGDKASLTPVAEHFAARGYAVFNLNYRLSGVARWPAQRTDTLAAVAHARRNAARYRFDAGRYVIVGFSAGGHLAASVGVHHARPRGLRGIVGFSPVVSPKTAYSAGGRSGASSLTRRLRSSALRLAGCGPRSCPSVWRSMEVAEHARPGDPPALMFHAEREFVPPAHSLLLPASVTTVRVLPGEGHSTELYRLPAVARAADRWIAAALH